MTIERHSPERLSARVASESWRVLTAKTHHLPAIFFVYVLSDHSIIFLPTLGRNLWRSPKSVCVGGSFRQKMFGWGTKSLQASLPIKARECASEWRSHTPRTGFSFRVRLSRDFSRLHLKRACSWDKTQKAWYQRQRSVLKRGRGGSSSTQSYSYPYSDFQECPLHCSLAEAIFTVPSVSVIDLWQCICRQLFRRSYFIVLLR